MLQRPTINMGSTSHADGLEKGDKEILCGIGNFKPKWLQVFNNATAMCVFITIYAFTHGKSFNLLVYLIMITCLCNIMQFFTGLKMIIFR